jgi:hypothetical protein
VATNNTYRGWTQTEYQNKRYNINQKDEGTQNDRGRDGGTNFIFTVKEHETRQILHDDDDDDELFPPKIVPFKRFHEARALLQLNVGYNDAPSSCNTVSTRNFL